jgi:methylmalonyl-CoA/ethylmalonyl-CoA epimerase
MSYVIHHIGFVVRDIDVALNGWLNLGFSIKTPKTKEMAIGVECILLQDQNLVYVELIQPLPGSIALSARINRGGGLDHLCYSVPNLEVAVAHEVAQGGVTVLAPTHSRLHDARICFVYRRSGLLVELLETPNLEGL